VFAGAKRLAPSGANSGYGPKDFVKCVVCSKDY